ncbi:hypothetical protein HN873_024983 [Arachis hypogaea]
MVARSLILTLGHCWFSAIHRVPSLLFCFSLCLAVSRCADGWSRYVSLPCLLEVEATFLLLSGLTIINIVIECLFFFIWLGVEIVCVLNGPISYWLLSKPAKGVEKTSSHVSPRFSLSASFKKLIPKISHPRRHQHHPRCAVSLRSLSASSPRRCYSILTVSVSATSFNRFLPKVNTTRDNVGRYRSSEAATVFRVSCSVSMSILPLLKESLLSLRCFRFFSSFFHVSIRSGIAFRI